VEDTIFEWSRNFEVWDYSERNIEALKQVGRRTASTFESASTRSCEGSPAADAGHRRALLRTDQRPRREVINALLARGLQTRILVGVYGRERDALI